MLVRIKRDDFIRALMLDGWVDTQTGNIVLAKFDVSDIGEVVWKNDDSILRDSDRFVRMPYVSDVWMCVDLIKKCIDPDILNEYQIDVDKFADAKMVITPPRLCDRTYTDEEGQFVQDVWRMTGDERLRAAVMAHDLSFLELIAEQWCKDNGFELVSGSTSGYCSYREA